MMQGIIPDSLRSVSYYLSPKHLRHVFAQFDLSLIASILDIFGLASLAPVLLVAAEPGGVQHSRFFYPIYQILDFGSERPFVTASIIALLLFELKNLFSTWVNYLQARLTAAVGLNIIRSQLCKYLHLPFWNFNDLGSVRLVNSTLQVPITYVSVVLRPLFVFFSELTVIAIIAVAMLICKPILMAVLALVLAHNMLLTER